MRDSRRSQQDLPRTCALQLKTLNQQKISDKLLQVILYACNNLFINCSLFDLASTCFTYCRKNFKKFIFLASPKTRFVTSCVGSRLFVCVRVWAPGCSLGSIARLFVCGDGWRLVCPAPGLLYDLSFYRKKLFLMICESMILWLSGGRKKLEVEWGWRLLDLNSMV